MINIAICDDQTKELNITKEFCIKYATTHPEHNIKISTFDAPSKFTLHIENQNEFNIILLDIYMPDMTGTELARFLRERNDDCQIVFLTTSLNHAVEAYSLHVAHYLVKPFAREQFDDALSTAIAAIEKKKNAHITLKTSGGAQKVYFADFLYSETEGHCQNIHLVGGKSVKVRITSTELYEILFRDSRFFKCGSTYIINMGKIEEVTERAILLENMEQLPMQRRRYKELINRYTTYSLER